MSKVIEKTVALQVQAYLNDNQLLPSFQSAYRQYHSTETALLKVTNDILMTIDSRRDAILILLDLSAAFDTLDHNILIKRLNSYFGFSGSVLQWFSSYIKDRGQSVVIGDVISSPQKLDYGIPQGSIVGPLLFTLYTAPLQQVILRHNLECMFYADDTQLYIAVNPKDPSPAYEALRNCIYDVITWNTNNLLMCNPEKTEVIHFSSKFNKSLTINPVFPLNNKDIEIRDKVRDLGVILDKNLSLSNHINEVCKIVTLTIRSIGRIRKYLSADSLKRLVNTLVTSRIDYTNSILYGSTDYDLNKLQRLQNTAARLIKGAKKNDHIIPILEELHWLPIRYRIQFKILLLVYKCLHGLAPQYLIELIKLRCPPRILRSSNRLVLEKPIINMASYGQRAFSYAGPDLWNTLPEHIKNSKSVNDFKKSLKTYFFHLAFK